MPARTSPTLHSPSSASIDVTSTLRIKINTLESVEVFLFSLSLRKRDIVHATRVPSSLPNHHLRLYVFIAAQITQVALTMLFKWGRQLGQSGK